MKSLGAHLQMVSNQCTHFQKKMHQFSRTCVDKSFPRTRDRQTDEQTDRQTGMMKPILNSFAGGIIIHVRYFYKIFLKNLLSFVKFYLRLKKDI